MSVDLREALAGKLLDASMELLLKRIASGEASAQELNAALKYIQEIGIKQVPTDVNPLGKVKGALEGLPDFTQQH